MLHSLEAFPIKKLTVYRLSRFLNFSEQTARILFDYTRNIFTLIIMFTATARLVTRFQLSFSASARGIFTGIFYIFYVPDT